MKKQRMLFLAVVFSIAIAVNYMLVLVVMEMPLYGNPDNPHHNYVAERYIEKGVDESIGYNLVGNILLDYRAYDTFLETTVIFCAVVAVALTLTTLNKTGPPQK